MRISRHLRRTRAACFPVNTLGPALAWQRRHLRGLVFFTESALCLLVELGVLARLPAADAASASASSAARPGASLSDRGCFVGVSSSATLAPLRGKPLNAIYGKGTNNIYAAETETPSVGEGNFEALWGEASAANGRRSGSIRPGTLSILVWAESGDD